MHYPPEVCNTDAMPTTKIIARDVKRGMTLPDDRVVLRVVRWNNDYTTTIHLDKGHPIQCGQYARVEIVVEGR